MFLPTPNCTVTFVIQLGLYRLNYPIDRTRKDGDCQFYHKTLRTDTANWHEEGHKYICEKFIPELTTSCMVGYELFEFL